MTESKEQLTADRAALAAARTSLLSGQAVQEYARDGRRVVYQRMSLESIAKAIDDVDAKLAAIEVATGAARPRFRALSVSFGGGRFRGC